jgi:hypothetical protein
MGVSLKNVSYVKFRDFVYLCYRGVKQEKIADVIGVSGATLSRWSQLPIFDVSMSMLMVGGLSDAVRYNLDVSAGVEGRDWVQRDSDEEESPF